MKLRLLSPPKVSLCPLVIHLSFCPCLQATTAVLSVTLGLFAFPSILYKWIRLVGLPFPGLLFYTQLN